MNDFKPNSNRFKEEQKSKEREVRATKVATGAVVPKKKSVLSEFISEDAKNIKSYVVGDVLIPSIKKAVCDIVKDSIEMLLYGGTKPSGRRSPADRVSYSSYSDRDSRYVRDTRSSAYSYDDIEFDTRGEAQVVLDSMDDLMDTYGLVRVADLYDLVGITGSYTDNKYGWTNISSAKIDRTRSGKYAIRMPRAIAID